MRNKRVRRVAMTGLLFALAIALGFLESLITPLLGLPPGVKPGLANIVVMYALLVESRKEALALVVLKAGFSALTRGGVAGMLSLTGGLVALGIMLLLMLLPKRPSVLILSIAGALGHNFGQFVMVRVLMGPSFLVYAPVLLVSGVAMGCLTAALLRVLLPALNSAGLLANKRQNSAKSRETGDGTDDKEN